MTGEQQHVHVHTSVRSLNVTVGVYFGESKVIFIFAKGTSITKPFSLCMVVKFRRGIKAKTRATDATPSVTSMKFKVWYMYDHLYQIFLTLE